MQSQINPYITSWFKPKITVENILTKKVKFNYKIPIILSGISTFIGERIVEFGLVGSIIVIIIGTAIMYMFIAYVLPWIILKTDKWINGHATFYQIQKIAALSQIPIIAGLVYQIVLAIFGQIKSYDELNIAVQFMIWLFSVRLLIIGIAKAQEISYGFALLNIILSFLPFFMIKLLLL